MSPTNCNFVFTMAQQPPSGSRPPHYRGFTITHIDALDSVGLLWKGDQPVALTPHNIHNR